MLHQRIEEAENLGLRQGVESCRWFVGDQELRIACEGERDQCALLESTRELVWIRAGVAGGGGDTDGREEFEHTRTDVVGCRNLMGP